MFTLDTVKVLLLHKAFYENLTFKFVFFLPRLISTLGLEGNFANRSPGTQGGYQAAGTCVAIAFGLVGGAIVGEFEKCAAHYSLPNLSLSSSPFQR